MVSAIRGHNVQQQDNVYPIARQIVEGVCVAPTQYAEPHVVSAEQGRNAHRSENVCRAANQSAALDNVARILTDVERRAVSVVRGHSVRRRGCVSRSARRPGLQQ